MAQLGSGALSLGMSEFGCDWEVSRDAFRAWESSSSSLSAVRSMTGAGELRAANAV